jgi:hypothetical protein
MWIGVSGEIGAAQGGALNLIIIDGFYTGFFLWKGVTENEPRLLAYGAGAGIATILIIAIFVWSLRVPIRDREPVPFLVRLSFFVFAVVLVVTGVLLLLHVPVFPWPVTSESSIFYGVICLGAACYFAHAVIWPSRANAIGQMLGFLVYDLVLIGPFIWRYATVEPEYRVSLIVYTILIVYSGVLAAFYLATNLLATANPFRELSFRRQSQR